MRDCVVARVSEQKPPSHSIIVYLLLMTTPRYCNEGLGEAHDNILRLFVQYGADIDPRELLSLQLLDGSFVFEKKNRSYINDKLTKYTGQARNPSSRWTVGALVVAVDFESNELTF